MFPSQTANREAWNIARQLREEKRRKRATSTTTSLALPFFFFLAFSLSSTVMQSISIRLPCVMHGGGVIRPAVADVHIKINAPLAMRNFHPSRTAEKAASASVSLKIHAAKAGRSASRCGICITNAQTASNEIHQSVLRRMNERALNRGQTRIYIYLVCVCACVSWYATRPVSVQGPIIQLTLSYTILLMRFYLIKLMPLMVPQ